MFSLFKRKPSTEPTFESLGADMHCHLIPGVDDGSTSNDVTIECLRTMQDVGFKKVYITPHFNFPRYPNEEGDIKSRYEKLKKELAEQAPDLTIELAGIAGEYRVDDGFRRHAEGDTFLKVAGKYVLVEFSLNQHRMGLLDTLFDLQMKDYEIILAHPERYPYYSLKSAELQQLKDSGVIFQCNILSLSGFYGKHAQQKALSYIEEGWVEMLGTDMHNVVYAHATRDASVDRTVQRVMAKYKFINNEL